MTASASDLRVGLIGYGMAGQYFHGPFIATTAGMRVHAIVTGQVDRQRQAAADHPAAIICPTADDLWALTDALDLVVVATPNATHVPLTMAAIDRGIPVLVDKPLAPTSDQALQLIEAAEARGVLLTVYQNRRRDADFLTLRELLASGELGHPLRFESRFERWRPSPRPGWRESAAPGDAGGLLMDLGSHLVDQAIVLFGPPVTVYAELDRRRAGVEVDDDAFIALTHEAGVRSHLWMSMLAADRAPRFVARGTSAAYVKFGLDEQAERLFAGGRPTDASWGIEPEPCWGRVVVDGVGKPVRSQPGAYQQFYAELGRAVRGQGPAPVDPRDAMRVLRVIEAARRSAESAQVVPFTA